MIDIIKKHLKKLAARCEPHNHLTQYVGETRVGEYTTYVFRCECGEHETRVTYHDNGELVDGKA